MPPRITDLTGARFGLLTVVGMCGVNEHNQSKCIVECECGVRKTMLVHNMKRGVQSCGSPIHRVKHLLDGEPLSAYCTRHEIHYATLISRMRRAGITTNQPQEIKRLVSLIKKKKQGETQ